MVYSRHLITPKGRSLASAGECSLTATPDGAVQQRHQLQQFTNGITSHLVEVSYALTRKQVLVVEQQETSPDSEIAEHYKIL